jgi:hypothetical protein
MRASLPEVSHRDSLGVEKLGEIHKLLSLALNLASLKFLPSARSPRLLTQDGPMLLTFAA